MFTDPSGMIPRPESICDRLPPDDAYECRKALECKEDPTLPEFPIPPNPTSMCDAQCMYEATTPLSDWRAIYSFSNPKRAASIRLLLSEMAWRFLSNQNWEAEATGILWTVENRVTWEYQRVILKDKSKKSIFHGCLGGYVDCAFAPGQYATTTTTRGRDPLYLDPDEPGRRRSYYHGDKYIATIINRAAVVANKVHYFGVPDLTFGAHFFSHNPDTVFAKMVDQPAPHHEHTITIPYIETSPQW